MGVKFLSLHNIIPWCFHLMGSRISCMQQFQPPESPAETIKLIKSDGLVKIYDRPVCASELMLEFPKHLVCRSDSFYIGQKIPALSENDHLQLGHNYFLLPKHCFQSALSFVTIASLRNRSNKDSTNEILKKAAACQPFDIQKSPSGCLRIRVSDEFIAHLMEESNQNRGNDKQTSKVCTTPQLLKDYAQLVRSRPWKPKLETIKEQQEKKKKRKKLSSFGIKTRKKSQINKLNQKSIKSSSSSESSHIYSTSTTTTCKPSSSKASHKAKSRRS